MVSSAVRKLVQRRARLHREIVRDSRFAPEDLVVIIAASEDEFGRLGGWRSRAELRSQPPR